MLLFILLAVVMIFLCRKVAPDLIRFEKSAYLSFLVTMVLVTAARLFSFVVLGNSPKISPDLFYLPSLFLVFWEDMFFVFPSILIYHFTKNRYLVAPVMLLSSLCFSVGHIYQSVEWAILLLAYVPFMFYLGRKHGLGTVMVAHVTYDVLTYLTIYFVSLGVL